MQRNCTGSQLYVFVISSNKRCTGTQCLQLHDILPHPLRQEGIHNDGRPRCIWCIRGHSCTGSHFLSYVQVKVEVIGWIYHLAGQQQFGISRSAPTASISTYICLLQPIQLQWGNKLVRVLSHHSYCGNHGHCDCNVALALGRIQWSTNADHCNGCHIGCLLLRDKTTQINSCTRLVPEILCMFRHQLCVEHDVTAAFLPQQG